jgi:heptosyltransferase-2
MKLLIELPDLIEDIVMITPALENLIKHHKDADITLVGSKIATQFFQNDKRIDNLIIKDDRSVFSFMALFIIARRVDKQDIFVSFRNTLYSKFFLFFVSAAKKFVYKDYGQELHKVEKYNTFINTVLQTDYKAGDLMLRFKPQWYKKRTLGIHPGSVYTTSKKRWEARRFAEVAKELSSKYEIVLLGGRGEVDICDDIESQLKEDGISCTNYAGKTSVSDLVEKIAALDLFLTIDCGPMQIASVYRVNTAVIPTSYEKIAFRNQWKNPLENIIYKHIDMYSEEESEDYIPTSKDVLDIFKS